MNQKQDFYGLMIENSLTGMFRMENGVFTYVNQALCDMFGYEKNELSGNGMAFLAHPDDRDKLENHLRYDINREQNRDNESHQFEFRGLRKDGSVIYIMILCKEIESDGAFIRIGNILDISEKQEAEIKLYESEERLKTIFRTADDAMYLATLEDGNIIMANDAFETIFGFKAEELIGRTSTSLNLYENPEDRTRMVAELSKTGKVRDFVCKGRRRNAEIFDASLSVTVLDLNDRKYIIGVIKDITESNRAAQKIIMLNRTYSLISQISQMTVKEKDHEELLKKTCEIAVDNGKFLMAWYGIVDEERIKVNPVYSYGNENGYLTAIRSITLKNVPEGQGPTAKAITQGRIFVCNDIENDPQMYPWRDEALKRGYRSSMAIPIKLFGKVIGSLSLYSSTANFFEDEEVTLLNNVVEDISFALGAIEIEKGKKEAEQAIIESEKLFSDLFYKSPVGIIITSPFEGTVIDINYTFLNDLEYSKKEVIGKTTVELGLYNDIKDREKLQEILKEYGHVIGYECCLLTKSGKKIYGLLSIVFIKIKGESYQLTTILDISDRKKAEVELSKSQDRFKQVVDSSGIWVWEVDTTGLYTYVSPSEEMILGYKPEEIVGKKHFYDFFTPDAKEELTKAAFSAFLRRESFKDFVNPNISKDGSLVILETSGFPMYDDYGRLIGYRGSDKDITDRKKAEDEIIKAKQKAEESDQLKTAFLCNISHEIRTPLNAIIGFGGLMNEPSLDQSERDNYFKIIKSRSDDLLQIINDILDISKIESNQFNLRETNGSLKDMMDDLNHYYKLNALSGNKKNIELIMEFGIDYSYDLINTDFVRLRQVINNLLNNAIKFTQNGKIEFGCKMTDDNYLLFHVSDTGIGIPEDMLEKVFERFRQVDASISRKFEGTGLGLSISKGIINLMGGTIWVESKIGEGSVFYVKIPHNPIHDLPSGKIVSKAIISDMKQKTVLIVEDDEYNRIYLEKLLKNNNINYLSADNGKTALDYFGTNPNIELVLLDIQLPDISGYEITKKMKKIRRSIRIIAQTGFAMDDDRSKCLDAGCDDFISKPISKEALLEMINCYMD